MEGKDTRGLEAGADFCKKLLSLSFARPSMTVKPYLDQAQLSQNRKLSLPV